MTSPQAGAPTIPVPTFFFFASRAPIFRGLLKWSCTLARVSTRRRRVFKINVMVIGKMWKLVGLLILTFWSRRWSQKIFFLAPPSGQNRKLKFPNTWILDKPEVTMWPEMKPEVFYRPKLSRNFLEWMTKTIMSHIIWLMIIVVFYFWPINLWIGFPSSGSSYSKTDFRIVFLMSSFISESYWLFTEMVDHIVVRWLLPVGLKSF